MKPSPRDDMDIYLVPTDLDIDIWTDGELMDMAAKGAISHREMILLAFIENTSTVGGIGCNTTNEEFAQKLNCQVEWVKRMITKLLKLELITRRKIKVKKRRIRILWAAKQRQIPPRDFR